MLFDNDPDAIFKFGELSDPFTEEPTVQANYRTTCPCGGRLDAEGDTVCHECFEASLQAKHPQIFAAALVADEYETPEFQAFMTREIADAKARWMNRTTLQQAQADAWNAYATAHSTPIVATIKGRGDRWSVTAPGRHFGGFSSRYWCNVFCANMGYTIDPASDSEATVEEMEEALSEYDTYERNLTV